MAKDDREISTAAKELKEYSTKANTLLQRQAKARDAYDAAKLAADEADQQLTLLETLGHCTTSGGSSAGDLRYLTDERIRQGDLVRQATASTADLKAKKDRAKADAAAAKKRLDSLQEKHAEELEESGPVMNALLGRTDESAPGGERALTDALEDIGQDVSDLERATPCSTNTRAYPNGQILPSGLCPLIGAEGESLLPDAAAAFNSMSAAYQRDTGSTLCVTDGYRSYSQQVVTKSQRGHFAATPGTSNHGLGTALDLCGGVNNFGHPAHEWMTQNAALYGWFHPSWAGPRGSLPEPWHWEFSG